MYGLMISHLQKTFRLQEYHPTIRLDVHSVPLACPSFLHLDYVVNHSLGKLHEANINLYVSLALIIACAGGSGHYQFLYFE